MYIVRQIIDPLPFRGIQVLLRQLCALKFRHKTESNYQVWEEGSKPKQINSNTMMEQKLEYIHNNPVKRGIVDDPVPGRYSSVRNYAELSGLIEVITDWQ